MGGRLGRKRTLAASKVPKFRPELAATIMAALPNRHQEVVEGFEWAFALAYVHDFDAVSEQHDIRVCDPIFSCAVHPPVTAASCDASAHMLLGAQGSQTVGTRARQLKASSIGRVEPARFALCETYLGEGRLGWRGCSNVDMSS